MTLSLPVANRQLPPQVTPPLVSTDTVMATVLSPTAATVVSGVGSSSAVVSGIASPAAAGQAVKAGTLARLSQCGLSSTLNEVEPPPLLDYPIQFHLNSKDGNLSLLAGATVANAMIVSVFFTALLALWVLGQRSRNLGSAPKQQKLTSSATPGSSEPTLAGHQTVCNLRFVQSKIFSTAFYVSLAYLGPPAFKGFVTFLVLSSTSAKPLYLLSGSFAGLAIIGGWLFTLIILSCKVPNWFNGRLSRSGLGLRLSPSNRRQEGAPLFVIETFGPLVDGCKDLSLPRRVYYAEDLLVSLLMMLCDGIQAGGGSCTPLGITIAIVSVLHLLYIALVRPLASALEMFLAFLGATLLCAMAILAATITVVRQQRGDAAVPSTLTDGLGWIAVLQSAFFFVELILLAGAAYARLQKRNVLRQWKANRSKGSLASEVHSSSRLESEDSERSSCSASESESSELSLKLLQVVPTSALALDTPAMEAPHRRPHIQSMPNPLSIP